MCVCVFFFFLPKTDLDTRYNRLLEVHVYASGRFYGTSVPEVPLKEKNGVLKAIFLNKVGVKISFILKRGNLIWNGRRKKGIYRSYIHILSQYHYGSTAPGDNWIYPGRRRILYL